MLPGPTIYKECPSCKKIVTEGSLASGNTFGAIHWSDGKMDAEMLPEFPGVVSCPECRELFWIKDAKTVGEYDWFNGEDYEEPEEWKKAKSVKDPGIEDYQNALNQGLDSSKDREKYIRVHLWWALNDLVRYEEKQPELFRQYQEIFQNNLESLVGLLENCDAAGQIMKAEIARELGEFETCLVRLAIIPKEHETLCNQLRQFVQQKSRIVQKLQMR